MSENGPEKKNRPETTAAILLASFLAAALGIRQCSRTETPAPRMPQVECTAQNNFCGTLSDREH